MKRVLLTALLVALPIPTGIFIYATPASNAVRIAVALVTAYAFIRLLRVVDPADRPVNSTPTATSEADPTVWPPQPIVNDIDVRRKDSRRWRLGSRRGLFARPAAAR